MEEQQAASADALGEAERIREPGMPPSDMRWVLVVSVLAIVDQQVDVAGKVEGRDPLRLEPGERGAERGLVVGDVGDRLLAAADAVAERRSSMGDRFGADGRSAKLPLAGG